MFQNFKATTTTTTENEMKIQKLNIVDGETGEIYAENLSAVKAAQFILDKNWEILHTENTDIMVRAWFPKEKKNNNNNGE